MTDAKPEKRGKGWASWTAASLISLPILYVFGSGPAEWLWCHPRATATTKRYIDTLYGPLDEQMRKYETTERWYFDWRDWWANL